jgi:hypothetical protein
MSINWLVALLWVQGLTAVGALILVGVWFLTGRKDTTLRVLAVVLILSSSVIGLYRALQSGAIF